MIQSNRRRFLKTTAAVFAAGTGAQTARSAEESSRDYAHVPFRPITEGPESHWFGYYDKLQFDPGNRHVLGMAVGFNDRAPQPDDQIALGAVDLEDDRRWIPLGTTNAWCWQQGCMLQWVPGSQHHVIYNDRREDRFVSVVVDVRDPKARTLPMPIYALSPNGKEAVTVNFARLNATRPGYGYAGVNDPTLDNPHPDNDGIFRLNLETGESQLIVSLDQMLQHDPQPSMKEGRHWFNHLLVNPTGTRFIFLHRWESGRQSGPRWLTRMFTANLDGSDLHCLADHKMVSHFIWRDAAHILAWSREPESGDRFHLYKDQSDEFEAIGEGILTQDGHCTYSPDGRWILVDTYPDSERMQHLRLYRPKDDRVVPLGKFYLPSEFKGRIRCDLHPRWSNDGRWVCIDSLHSGKRQMYLLDVSEYTMA